MSPPRESGDELAGGAEPRRDAHLREALRHAPDAGLEAPQALREHILSQARQATASPPRRASPAGLADALAAAWQWLARPPVASGFAGLMVATLATLMWWQGPPDEAPTEVVARDERGVTAPTAPAAAAQESKTGHAAPAAEPAGTAAARPEIAALPAAAMPPVMATPAATANPAATAAPAVTATPAAAAMERATQRVTPAMPAAPATPAPAPAATIGKAKEAVAPAPPTEPRAEAGKREAEARADDAGALGNRVELAKKPASGMPAEAVRESVAAPATRREEAGPRVAGAAPAQAGAAAAPTDLAADTRSAARQAVPAATDAPARVAAAPPAAPADAGRDRKEAAAGMADASRADADADAAPRRAAPQAQGPNLAEPAEPLDRLQAVITSAPGRWQWQQEGAPPRAMNDVLLAWIERAGVLARGRWQVIAPADTASMPAGTIELRLWLDGRPHSSLRLDAAAIRVTPEAGGAGPSLAPQRATLTPSAAASLRAALVAALR